MALTTKHKMAEAAYRIVNGGHPNNDNKLRIQDYVNYCSGALAGAIGMKYFQNKVEGESYIDGSFIYTFRNQVVSKDTDQDLYYSELPSTVMSLPREMGVHQVSLSQGQGKPFIPMRNGFVGLLDGLASSNMEGNFGYYIEGERIYYHNMAAKHGIDKVMMKLVLPLGSIDDDEQINIPDDVEVLVIDKLVERFGPTINVPKDNTNDDIDE